MKKTLEKKTRLLRTEAEEQLKRYTGDEKFGKTIGQTKALKLVLIFCGHELQYIGEVRRHDVLDAT